MVGVLELAGYVQRQGELGRARGQETLLNRLAGQAYSAAPEQRNELLSQMATVSPQAAQTQQQQFRTGDADRVSQLSQKAKLFVSMVKAGNQEAAAGMYPDIARGAKEAFGINVSETYDPAFLPGLEQLGNMGAGQAGTAVQSTYIDDRGQRVAIMRDGSTQVLGGNAPNNQIIDTGNGFYGVNKGNLNAAPVQIGGGAPQQPQAPQAGMYQTPQGVVRLGDDLSPEQREAAMADVAAGGQASAVQLPDRSVSQPTGGGQQLFSAPKPQAPSELDRRLEAAREMGATPEQLRAIVLGNASPNGPSAVEQRDALARKAKQPQVANAVRGVERIRAALKSLSGGMAGTFGLVDTGPVDQYAARKTVAGQELETATGAMQNSLLSLTRVPGIGSQSDLEARIANMQYPSLDKAPEVNARSMENLAAFVADLEEAYRMADIPMPAIAPAPSGDGVDDLLLKYGAQ